MIVHLGGEREREDGHGYKGAWPQPWSYTGKDTGVLAPFIGSPGRHRMWAGAEGGLVHQGGKDPGPIHYGSPAEPQDVGRGEGGLYTMFIHSQEGRGPGPIHYRSPAEPPDVGRGEGGLVHRWGPLGDCQVPLGGGGARGTCRRPQERVAAWCSP